MNTFLDEIKFLRSLRKSRRIVREMEASHPWLKITDGHGDCDDFQQVAIFNQYVEHTSRLGYFLDTVHALNEL